MIGILLMLIIAGLSFLLYGKIYGQQGIWRRKGIPYQTPIPYIGNLMDNLLKKKSLAEVIKDTALKFKDEPLVGFFFFTKPALIVTDPDYVETVLVKEFSSFMNRGEDLRPEERRPFDKNLFFICGSTWKAVRSKMTPVFTSGKLKGMVQEIGRIFDETFKDVNATKLVEINNIIEMFTVRVRASCVFGIDLLTSTSEVEFLRNVKETSNPSLKAFIASNVAFFFPKLAKKFDFSFIGTKHENYFVETLLNSFQRRQELNIVKNDFVQTLMELKNTGKVDVQHWTQEDNFLKTNEQYSTTETIEIDDDILLSQCIIFLIGGLEPQLSTLTMLLLELSRNPDIYEKLRQEIDSTINRHNEFSFQALKELEFLELCIKETLRLYTPAEIIIRHCCKSYTFPNGVTVDKGTDLFIPLTKLHLDPAIFPDPMDFKPERFKDSSYPVCSYLPFGQGPRVCIGTRFALMEMKMLMAKLVYNYDFSLDPTTEIPVKTSKWYILRKNITPIYMIFSPRDCKKGL